MLFTALPYTNMFCILVSVGLRLAFYSYLQLLTKPGGMEVLTEDCHGEWLPNAAAVSEAGLQLGTRENKGDCCQPWSPDLQPQRVRILLEGAQPFFLRLPSLEVSSFHPLPLGWTLPLRAPKQCAANTDWILQEDEQKQNLFF